MKYDIDDLIFLNMAGVGYTRLRTLIEYFGDIKKALRSKAADLERTKNIGPILAEKISGIKKSGNLKNEWSLIKEKNVTVLSIFDKDYPENLKNIYDPPIVLYMKGRILPQDKTAVAVVGSRRASLYGVNICQSLSGQLASLGITVISGLARGIDSAAHSGALKLGGRTLAILGNGLNTVYPPENGRLAEEIVHSGALISEFPMETPPLARNFPIRNRIISGLSLGIVVVEAARDSGALITANCGLEQGREIFAVPGKAGTATSTGTHRLIKEGARLIESADEIIEELNLSFVPFSRTSIGNITNGIEPKGLSLPEKRLYDILSDEPEHIDDIIDKSKLPVQEVLNLLLKLEIKKLVKELPGRNFITVTGTR